ncbi:MAG: hypothetical protein ACLSTO_11215 [Bilophila wadsworthia]
MNMPFLTMQALLGTDKRPPELPADDSEPGRLTQAIAATRTAPKTPKRSGCSVPPGCRPSAGWRGYRRPAPTPPSRALPAGTPASVDEAAVIDVLRQSRSSGSDRMRPTFRLMLGAGKVLLGAAPAGAGAWAPHAVPARAHRPDRRGTRPLARRTERRMEPLRHQCRKRA